MSIKKNDKPVEGYIDDAVSSIKAGSFSPPEGAHNHHAHGNSFSTVRRAEHRGRKIVIRTTYRIEIDDEPLSLHVMVMDDGSVHCHGMQISALYN